MVSGIALVPNTETRQLAGGVSCCRDRANAAGGRAPDRSFAPSSLEIAPQFVRNRPRIMRNPAPCQHQRPPCQAPENAAARAVRATAGRLPRRAREDRRCQRAVAGRIARSRLPRGRSAGRAAALPPVVRPLAAVPLGARAADPAERDGGVATAIACGNCPDQIGFGPISRTAGRT